MWNQKKNRSINIFEISGDVTIVEENKEYEAYQGMHLQQGHTIVTSGNSYTRMLIDEDKYIKLEEGSRAAVKSLANGRTEISLERGAITNEIIKPLYEGQSYIIHTPNATLAVRGTYFCVDISTAEDGDLVTKVFTYGGSVISQRKMPDGELVEEAVVIDAGYKATINMDEAETIYIEEMVEEKPEYVIPINPAEISDDDLADIYFAAQNGHEMFTSTEDLLQMAESRSMDINSYTSAYQKAENLGISGKGIAPDDGISRIEDEQDSVSTDRHDAPYDGSKDTANDTFGKILEGILSVFKPLDEEELAVETEEITGSEVATNTEDLSDNGIIGETEGTPEREITNNTESTPENGITDNLDNLPTVPGTENLEETEDIPKIEELPKEEEIVDTEGAEENTDNSQNDNSSTDNSGGSSSSGNAGGSVSSNNTPAGCNHSITTERREPTCTQAGEEVNKCSLCNEVLNTTVLPATGHTEVTETSEPNCLGEATETVKCSVCNEEISTAAVILTEKGEHEENDTADACKVCSAIKIASEANFKDEKFQEYIQTNCDTDGANGDGYLTTEEREAVTAIYLGGEYSEMEILDGLDKFPNTQDLQIANLTNLTQAEISELSKLTNLKIARCSNLQSLDISQNINLETLYLGSDGGINGLDMSNNTKLKTIELWGDVLHNVSFENLNNLETLDILDEGQMTTLDLSGNSNLQKVEIIGNGSGITTITLGSSTNKLNQLTEFYVNYIGATAFDFSNCPNLNRLTLYRQTVNQFNIDGCNSFTQIFLSACTFAQNLDISGRTDLQTLYLDGTTITSGTLNVNNCSQMTLLSLNENGATQKIPNIKNIYIQNCTSLGSLDLGNVTGLEKVYVKGTSATISGIDSSKIDNN